VVIDKKADGPSRPRPTRQGQDFAWRLSVGSRMPLVRDRPARCLGSCAPCDDRRRRPITAERRHAHARSSPGALPARSSASSSPPSPGAWARPRRGRGSAGTWSARISPVTTPRGHPGAAVRGRRGSRPHRPVGAAGRCAGERGRGPGRRPHRGFGQQHSRCSPSVGDDARAAARRGDGRGPPSTHIGRLGEYGERTAAEGLTES
jgi:hypothetical protein